MNFYLRTRILASDLEQVPSDSLTLESLQFKIKFKVPKVSKEKTKTDTEVWNLSKEDIKYVTVSQSLVDNDYLNVDWIISMDETVNASYFRNRYFEGHDVTLIEVLDAAVMTVDGSLALPNEVMEVEFSSSGQTWFRQEHVLNRYTIEDLIKGVLSDTLK